MAIREIRLFPDPVLREKAQPVDVVDDDVRRLVADMGETMRNAPGVGLAAPQVGIPKRIVVFSPSEEEPITALINPEILSSDGEQTDVEGCLSMPGIGYEVTRANHVIVKGLDARGEPIEIDASEFVARILQHEIDHLDGILFIDRIDPDLRKEALKELREAIASGAL
jgi:peptide deformylase